MPSVSVSDRFLALVQRLPMDGRAWTEDEWSRFVACLDVTGRYFLALPMPTDAGKAIETFGVLDMLRDAQTDLETAREQVEAVQAAMAVGLAELRRDFPDMAALDGLRADLATLREAMAAHVVVSEPARIIPQPFLAEPAPAEPPPPEPAETEAPSAAVCPDCGRSFATKFGLGGHRGRAHRDMRAKAEVAALANEPEPTPPLPPVTLHQNDRSDETFEERRIRLTRRAR